jgi:agmatinase
VAAAISRGALSVGLGGDGSVALAEMRALHARYGALAVIHFDAHTDAYPIEGYNNATPFSRAHDEGLVETAKSFHVGYRRSNSYPDVVNYGRQLGYSVISMDDFIEGGIVETMTRIRSAVGTTPVYLCFDMDFFDPSVAPGVCNPAWGGATAREGLRALRECRGLDICGLSINTITPAHDVGGMSAMLAATVAYEVLLMQAAGAIGTSEHGRHEPENEDDE